MPSQDFDELDYLVEMYSDLDRRFVLIAASASLLVGRAAFEEAVRIYPTKSLMFRHRARIIAQRSPG
jgi:hypothetical protein